jgi:hypothetical protein
MLTCRSIRKGGLVYFCKGLAKANLLIFLYPSHKWDGNELIKYSLPCA